MAAGERVEVMENKAERRVAVSSIDWLGLFAVHFFGLSEILWKKALLAGSSHEDGLDERYPTMNTFGSARKQSNRCEVPPGCAKTQVMDSAGQPSS